MFSLIFLCVLMVSVRVGDGVNCTEELHLQFEWVTEHSLTAVTSDFSVLVVDIYETLSGGSILYYIMWDRNLVVPPYIDEDADSNTALEYINVYTDGPLETRLKYSLRGLVDYGHDGRMTDLDYFFYFEFNSTDVPNVCKLQVSHHIVDQETQYPNFDQSSYSVELREDFPLYYPIPAELLQVKIYDYDASPTNNRLYVDVVYDIYSAYDCPLSPNQTYYEPQNGAMVTLPLYLTSPLDYEELPSSYVYNCTLVVTDPYQHTAYSSIYISVAPGPDDEIPVLSRRFYNGILMSVTVGSVVVVEPEIRARDPDYPNVYNPTMFYSISGTDTVGGEKYFQMNSSTGIVTVKTEISQDLLPLKEISFTFTACDVGSQCTVGFLTIKLPYMKPFKPNNLQFEKRIYSVEVADPVNGDELLRVHVQTTDENQQNIIYSLTGSSSGQLYFNINESSGIISVITDKPPANTHTLTVMASNGIINTTSEVNIKVSSMKDQLAFTTESFVSLTAPQWFYLDNDVIYTIKAEEAGAFCLLNVEPLHFLYCLEVDKTTGDLKVVCKLDIDYSYKPYGNVIHVRVGAYRDEDTSCQQAYFSDIIYKNEVEIEIEVIDNDDYEPYFVDQREIHSKYYNFYYPTEIHLQKILRKVATLKVKDDDFNQVASTFSDNIESSKYYDFDNPTSAILPIGGGYVPSNEYFHVTVNDSFYFTTIVAEIYPLNLESIFTIRIRNTSLSHIEEKLMDISKEEYLNLYLLYFNVIEKNYDSNLWTIDAHVYATGSYTHTIVDLISVLSYWTETNLCETPRVFADKKHFETDTTSEDTDYKTAMIVLSTILGCLCFGVFGFYFCISLKKCTGK